AAMAEHIEEDLENGVLNLVVPLCGQTGEGVEYRGGLCIPVLPWRLDRDKDAVTTARHVGPSGRLHVVHGDFEAVRPEQIQGHIAHQLELRAVIAFLDALQDVGAGRRLGIEVALDDGIELLEAFEGREVKVWKAIGRKDELAMLVQFKGMHCRSPFAMRVLLIQLKLGREERSKTKWRSPSHVQTAVYPPNLSSDIARCVRSQEMHNARDLPRLGQPAHGDAALDSVEDLLGDGLDHL